MDVIVYTKQGCENSRRIKELLAEKGVAFHEHLLADQRPDGCDGKVDPRWLQSAEAPVTVVDGVVIEGMNRAQIEQAIGWVGF